MKTLLLISLSLFYSINIFAAEQDYIYISVPEIQIDQDRLSMGLPAVFSKYDKNNANSSILTVSRITPRLSINCKNDDSDISENNTKNKYSDLPFETMDLIEYLDSLKLTKYEFLSPLFPPCQSSDWVFQKQLNVYIGFKKMTSIERERLLINQITRSGLLEHKKMVNISDIFKNIFVNNTGPNVKKVWYLSKYNILIIIASESFQKDIVGAFMPAKNL